MQRVTEYKIINQTSVEALEAFVNDALKEGFTLHGNTILTVYPNGNTVFLQPMIKYEQESFGENRAI